MEARSVLKWSHWIEYWDCVYKYSKSHLGRLVENAKLTRKNSIKTAWVKKWDLKVNDGEVKSRKQPRNVWALFVQRLERFNFGILIAGDLNFLCVAHLVDMCRLSAAEKWQRAGFRDRSQLVRSLNLGGREGGRKPLAVRRSELQPWNFHGQAAWSPSSMLHSFLVTFYAEMKANKTLSHISLKKKKSFTCKFFFFYITARLFVIKSIFIKTGRVAFIKPCSLCS